MKELQAKHPTMRRELREKIIIAAGELFAKDGIRSVTMDDIAASFGISKRTLYELFSDKEALLIDCIRMEMELEEVYMREQAAQSYNVLL